MQGLETAITNVEDDALFVTMKITSDLYDCNHNCLTGVIARTDPSFQTAMRHDDLFSIKDEIKEFCPDGINFSQIDYEQDDRKGILVIVRYEADVLKHRVIERFNRVMRGFSYDDDALKQQAIGELVATVERLMKNANRVFKTPAIRAATQC